MEKISAERAKVSHNTDSARCRYCFFLCYRPDVSDRASFSLSSQTPVGCISDSRLDELLSACVVGVLHGRLFSIGEKVLCEPKDLNGRKSYRRPLHDPVMSAMLDDDFPNKLLVSLPRVEPATFAKIHCRFPLVDGLRR